SFGIEDELKRFAAERFGRTVGRWLYLVDAVDDYEDDLKKKRFTPFANVPPDKQLIGNALDALCNDADLLLAKIPVYNPSYRAILTNVLYHGMHEEARKILFPEQSQRKDKINERSL
ncbi:MAG: hypothetical protein IJY89_04220, partial [Clostridia bacterium]|nr:hypothetical protein [Clostridia bacterium]